MSPAPTLPPGTVAASRPVWASQLIAEGRPDLALRLLDAGSGRDDDPLLRASAQVLAGDLTDARAVLGALDIELGHPAEASLPEVLLATTLAGAGDDQAQAWLADVVPGERITPVDLARLHAVVADARHRPESFDIRADLAVDGRLGTPVQDAGAVARLVFQRGRKAPADQQLFLLNRAMTVLTTWADSLGGHDEDLPGDHGRTVESLATALRLLESWGDPIGAWLLHATASVWLPADERLAALRPARPRRRVRDVILLVLLGLVVVVGLVFAAVVAQAPPPLLVGSAIALVILVRRHHALRPARPAVPTESELLVARALRDRRIDPRVENVVVATQHGWAMTAGVLGGGVAGAAVGYGLPALGLALLGSPAAWDPALGMIPGILVGMFGGRVVARRRVRATLRRRGRVAHAVGLVRLEENTSRCRCWLPGDVSGSWARRYLANHLDVTSEPAPLPGTVVATCPDTALTWLVGPVGGGDGLVALRGVRPSRSEPGTGAYL